MSDCRKCAKFEECAVDEDCGLFVDKPMTNADRIRAMTDEELAEWIMRKPSIRYFAVCPPGTGDDCPTSPCEQCWLDWLKSPVEVGNGKI